MVYSLDLLLSCQSSRKIQKKSMLYPTSKHNKYINVIEIVVHIARTRTNYENIFRCKLWTFVLI